jgi:hypothetical protein
MVTGAVHTASGTINTGVSGNVITATVSDVTSLVASLEVLSSVLSEVQFTLTFVQSTLSTCKFLLPTTRG